MVCIPCFAIPVLLVIWRFIIQPILMKWWSLRNKNKEAIKDEQPPQLAKECNNGVCTLSWKKKEDNPKTD